MSSMNKLMQQFYESDTSIHRVSLCALYSEYQKANLAQRSEACNVENVWYATYGQFNKTLTVRYHCPIVHRVFDLELARCGMKMMDILTDKIDQLLVENKQTSIL